MTIPVEHEAHAGDGTRAATTNTPPVGRASIASDITLGALRLVAGLMLMQHGVQKHAGWLLPPDQPFAGPPTAYSQMWFAGTLEIAGGLLLAIGLLTRPVAFVLSGFMAFAFFLVHAPQGFWPILNGGELAALYCFVFLMFAAIGGGRFSIDAVLGRPHGRAADETSGPPASSGYPNDRRKQRRRKTPRVTSQ